MGRKGRGPGTVPDDTRFDDGAARTRGQAAQRAKARGAPPPEGGARAATRARAMQAAGLLRRRENARNEALPLYRRLRSDAARTNVDFIVTRHDRNQTR